MEAESVLGSGRKRRRDESLGMPVVDAVAAPMVHRARGLESEVVDRSGVRPVERDAGVPVDLVKVRGLPKFNPIVILFLLWP